MNLSQFSEYTYEKLLAGALNQVPDTLDKRPSSPIYIALAPACYKLAEYYMELYNAYRDISADTAIGASLTERCSEVGVNRYPATKALRKLEADGAVPVGARLSLKDTTYVCQKQIGTSGYNYQVECEQAGSVGNQYTGDATFITAKPDAVTKASLTSILTAGVDEETDDELRARYRTHLNNPPEDGNEAQYLKWAREFTGVGVAKVFANWNGGNTVKVAITNPLHLPADAELVKSFQLYMDPESRGLGQGKAPIGSIVTVTGGTPKTINISGTVNLVDGFSAIDGVAEAIRTYFSEITFVKSSVSYMRVGNAILDCPCIADLAGLLVNSSTSDIAITGDEIPVLGTLNLVVSD